MKTLTDYLSLEDIQNLQFYLIVPAGIRERTKCNTSEFIFSLRDEWTEFNPEEFPEALKRIGREDLINIAHSIPWLCCKSREIDRGTPANKFIVMLRNELALEDLKFIIRTEMKQEVGTNFTFVTGFQSILESRAVEPDLTYMCGLMKLVRRLDLIEKIQKYKTVFGSMSDKELQRKLKAEFEKYSHKQKNQSNELYFVFVLIYALFLCCYIGINIRGLSKLIKIFMNSQLKIICGYFFALCN